jgi:hypothetical protein
MNSRPGTKPEWRIPRLAYPATRLPRWGLAAYRNQRKNRSLEVRKRGLSLKSDTKFLSPISYFGTPGINGVTARFSLAMREDRHPTWSGARFG